MGLVDAGVQYGDLDPGAVEPGLPGRRGADLRDTPVQGRLAPAVQPYPGDARCRRPGSVSPVAGGGQRLPDLGRVALGRGQRLPGDGGQATAHADVRGGHGGFGGRPALPGVRDDQRHRAAVRVVVASPQQPCDVEQAAVQGALADQGQGIGGHDVGVGPDLPDGHRDVLASRAGLDADHLPIAIDMGPVAGDQCDDGPGAPVRRSRCPEGL